MGEYVLGAFYVVICTVKEWDKFQRDDKWLYFAEVVWM